MKNVSDGEVILKGCDHQHHGRKKDDCEAGNAGAARGFTQPLRSRSLDDECQQSCQEGVSAQRQREEKRKTTYLRHWGNLGLYFFRNDPQKQPRRLDRQNSPFLLHHVCAQLCSLPGRERPGLRGNRNWRNFTPRRIVDDFWWREFRARL
jgi:hypothetical protein